jgi:hypothetical protein
VYTEDLGGHNRGDWEAIKHIDDSERFPCLDITSSLALVNADVDLPIARQYVLVLSVDVFRPAVTSETAGDGTVLPVNEDDVAATLLFSLSRTIYSIKLRQASARNLLLHTTLLYLWATLMAKHLRRAQRRAGLRLTPERYRRIGLVKHSLIGYLLLVICS